MAIGDKSAVVSGAGWIAGFVDRLVEELQARDCTNEDIHALVTSRPRPKLAMGKIADAIAELIRTAKNAFRLTKIGDGRTTEELVRDGKYNYVNPNITSQDFPVRPRQGAAEIVILEFDRDITSEEAIAEAKKLDLQRPVYEDALYFGVEHPEVQREGPVVFLHEPWLDAYGGPDVLYLGGDAGSRELFLGWFDGRWRRDGRFAFVRK